MENNNNSNSKAFPLRPGASQGCSHLPCPFSTVLMVRMVLLRAVRQEKTTEGVHIRKEEGKVFLFVYYLILYMREPEDSTRKLLELNTFSKVFPR